MKIDIGLGLHVAVHLDTDIAESENNVFYKEKTIPNAIAT